MTTPDELRFECFEEFKVPVCEILCGDAGDYVWCEMGYDGQGAWVSKNPDGSYDVYLNVKHGEVDATSMSLHTARLEAEQKRHDHNAQTVED